jgi:hypothetical protein
MVSFFDHHMYHELKALQERITRLYQEVMNTLQRRLPILQINDLPLIANAAAFDVNDLVLSTIYGFSRRLNLVVVGTPNVITLVFQLCSDHYDVVRNHPPNTPINPNIANYGHIQVPQAASQYINYSAGVPNIPNPAQVNQAFINQTVQHNARPFGVNDLWQNTRAPLQLLLHAPTWNVTDGRNFFEWRLLGQDPFRVVSLQVNQCLGFQQRPPRNVVNPSDPQRDRYQSNTANPYIPWYRCELKCEIGSEHCIQHLLMYFSLQISQTHLTTNGQPMKLLGLFARHRFNDYLGRSLVHNNKNFHDPVFLKGDIIFPINAGDIFLFHYS